MNGSSHVSRALHDEHRANLSLLGRLEMTLARGGPPAAGDRADEFKRLLREFVALVENDMNRHFLFEENELFPRLSDAGESDIAEALGEEHQSIRAVAEDLLPLARLALEQALNASQWNDLRRDAAELIERQVAHIQKEEMALLPALGDLLDETTDSELAIQYAAS